MALEELYLDHYVSDTNDFLLSSPECIQSDGSGKVIVYSETLPGYILLQEHELTGQVCQKFISGRRDAKMNFCTTSGARFFYEVGNGDHVIMLRDNYNYVAKPVAGSNDFGFGPPPVVGTAVSNAVVPSPECVCLNVNDSLLAFGCKWGIGVISLVTSTMEHVFNLRLLWSACTFGNTEKILHCASTYTIIKIDLSQNIVAAELVCGKPGVWGFADGPKFEALFNFPTSILMDMNHDIIYIADHHNHRIRMCDNDAGIVTTLVGNGSTSNHAMAGSPLDISLAYPYGICYDAHGDIVISLPNADALSVLRGITKPVSRAVSLDTIPKRMWVAF